MPDIDGFEVSKIIRRDLNLTLPIIMLTAFGKEIEKLADKQSIIDGFLTKPIQAASLFEIIMGVFGKQEFIKDKHITTKTSIFKKNLNGISVLVAEDNPTNQEIAEAILEGAGISVEIANDGVQAIEAVQRKSFDAVLMDIQMPNMDGLEAAKKIRTLESKPEVLSQIHRLPIIAMTAHAMKGDEQKCLDAGMDGYVTKPVNQDQLFRVLSTLVKAKETSIQEPALLIERQEALPTELPGLSIQAAMDGLNIDPDIFRTILLGFLRHNKDTIKKLWSTFKNREWEVLRGLAHGLKGSGANIGANQLARASNILETASRGGGNNAPRVRSCGRC